MEFAEFMLKIGTLVVLIIGVLGMVVQSTSLEGYTKSVTDRNSAINLANVLASAPCLVTKVLEEPRTGILDSSALDQYEEAEFCINFSANWYAKIETENKKWQFGTVGEFAIDDSKSYVMPIVVREGENFIPARIIAKVSLP